MTENTNETTSEHERRRRHRAAKRLALAAVGTGLLAAPLVALAGPAAAADEHASCIGHEAAGVSPPGSSDEFPGGVPEIHRLFVSLDLKTGPVFSEVARLHEGSHEACDAATE